MPDESTAVATTPACPTCGGRRVVPRLHDSGRRRTRRARIRAAWLVPCPTCTTPPDHEQENPDA